MAIYRIPAALENAFIDGFSQLDDTGNLVSFFLFDLGKLKVTSGRIIACDPLIFGRPSPFTASFPVGWFSVELAIARSDDDDQRVAFARVRFSDEAPVSWVMATCADQDPETLSRDEIFGYGVDSGTGSFMDVEAEKELVKFVGEDAANAESLDDDMNKNYQDTWSWSLWERNEHTVAMFSSGLGDGVYASYIGMDAEGRICRLVTDFSVIDS